MTYLSDRTHKRKTYLWYLLLVILFITLVYAWPSIHKSTYTYFEKTIILFGNAKNYLFDLPSNISVFFVTREELSARSRDLLLTIEQLENKLAEKNELLKELGLLENSDDVVPKKTLIMHSLMRDFTSVYSSVVLSKGFKDGVEENGLVYIHGRQPVCIIKEVYDRTSLCELLSASGNAVEGIVASSTVLYLKGKGGGAFVADVPKDTGISLGEVVVLKGDPSMILGTVVNIVHNDQASSLYLYVRGGYSPVTSTVFYMSK
mgnify:CR=1 FL=1